jgi:hypothetical protein
MQIELPGLPGEPYTPSEKFEALRAELNAERDAIRTAGVNLTAAMLAKAPALKLAGVQLLQRALRFRIRLRDEFYPRRSYERRRTADALQKELEDARAKVYGLLQSIGYVDHEDPRLTISNDMVGRHPLVREAWAKHFTVQGTVNSDDERRMNDQAIEPLNEEITRATQKLVSAAL